MDKYRWSDLRERARLQPLVILIWGPGKPASGSAAEVQRRYDKRVQMKSVLRKAFPNAKVYFSEDRAMQRITRNLGSNLRQEAVHAYLADGVIMLDISRGTDLELDHFVPTYPWFRDKVRVLLPKRYTSSTGLVKDVFAYLHPTQVIGFSVNEFQNCSVATNLTVDLVYGIAIELVLRRP